MLEDLKNRSHYPAISLEAERKLIRKAQTGCQKATEELVLRHIRFIIFRIYKKAFPSYIARFGKDIFSEAVFILYEKIQSYNLDYTDRLGELRPVRFKSYVWKRIDGFILDSLKAEIERERLHLELNLETFEG